MAISAAALKGMLGVGAISALAIGGTYVYKSGLLGGDSGLEKAVLSSNGGWSVTATPSGSNNIQNGTKVEIKTTWTGNIGGASKTWTCKIQGTIETHTSGHTIDVEDQKSAFEKEIGIKDGKRATNKNYSFKKFFENCRNSNTKTTTKGNFESTLTKNQILETSESKYKFKEAELKNFYYGTKELLEKLGLQDHETEQNTTKEITLSSENNLKIPTGTKIKIEKTDDTVDFPEGLKFILVSETDMTSIGIKANTDTEFRIKENENSYSLEKSWNITTLAEKVGLNCLTNQTENTCDLISNQKINVYQNDNSREIGATFTLSAGQKINFEAEKAGYNQGFKLTVSEDINLTLSGNTGNPDKLKKENTSYEIGIRNYVDTKKWFLIELGDQEVKERKVGISCSTTGSDTTCSQISGRTVKGLDSQSSVSLKRSAESDVNKYPDKYKYTHSSGSNENNYKIECSTDTNNECSLKKVSA